MKKMNLVLGTMTFGESVFEPEVKQFIDSFLQYGYYDIDTAYVYNNGNCEELIGDALAEIGNAYDYKIATKVNPRITGRLDSDAAYKQVNESLKRMKRDNVDIVYLHVPDPFTPVESVLEAMTDLHEQGKFKELGLSNYQAWMVADIWHKCEQHGWIKPTIYQGRYNPLTRGAESELKGCVENYGMRFYAFNPLAGGILSGKYSSFDAAPEEGRFTHRPHYKGRYWKQSFFNAVNVIKEAAEKYDMSCIQATYRWLAFHSMLDSNRDDAVIIGASSLKHLIQNMDTFEEGPIPTEVLDAFDQAWEMTKGDCPEYYTLYKGAVKG